MNTKPVEVSSEFAKRLDSLAAEIRTHQKSEEDAFESIVRGVDWGRYDPHHS
ncbi:hypothetical protein ACR5KS_02995 [Leucobacter sp. W1153]|uniref:hypothetical protein n=1 Tax=Leucobacter sp. W1153 TaxID=3439064 RepID=UPI003F2F15BA